MLKEKGGGWGSIGSFIHPKLLEKERGGKERGIEVPWFTRAGGKKGGRKRGEPRWSEERGKKKRGESATFISKEKSGGEDGRNPSLST